MYSYRFTRAAEKDLEEAYLWYEDQQEELGIRLLDDVERACRYIAQSPDRYPVYNKDRRRFLLKAIGSIFTSYVILYRILEKEKAVIIIAVAHTSRNPRVWQSR